MSGPIFNFVKGSAEGVQVQLYPADDTTGSDGISLTGATSLSAKAKHTENATTVTLTCTVVNAAEGIVQVSWGASDFNTGGVGVYDLQILFSIGGSPRIYPSEDGGLRLQVNEAN